MLSLKPSLAMALWYNILYNTNQEIHLLYTDEKQYYKINIYKITLKLSEYKWNLDDSKIDMGWYQKNVDSTSIPVLLLTFDTEYFNTFGKCKSRSSLFEKAMSFC